LGELGYIYLTDGMIKILSFLMGELYLMSGRPVGALPFIFKKSDFEGVVTKNFERQAENRL
jgi:hypothetical protein